jgi:hypothetical protein
MEKLETTGRIFFLYFIDILNQRIRMGPRLRVNLTKQTEFIDMQPEITKFAMKLYLITKNNGSTIIKSWIFMGGINTIFYY